MKLDIEKLRVVAQVGRVGSMTAAARSLHLTPSAVSQTVQRVESVIGLPLFERRPHGMALTDAGERVMRRVNLIEAQMAQLETELRSVAEGRAGHLSLGVFPTLGSSLLPRIVMDFRARHPTIILDVRSTRLVALRQLIGVGELDLAITWTYPWLNEPGSTLQLRTDPTVVLLPAGHAMAQEAGPLNLAELAKEAWVCRSDGHEITELLHRAAAQCKFTPRIALLANDYQETQAMVAAGLGVALAPKLSTTTCRADIVVRDLDDSVPSRQLHLVQAPNRSSPAVEPMIELLRTLLSE
ncbi:LysR family transcriptional regulator [Pseudomonas sp. PS01301]|uniref:LysR family transcriptional regulator n=1 Tax=Pseudomonas sp. PS01301 TaxID=2991437 RepID=UPI00249B9786|nr:LysR family transcriptional regulator [Pseudomonas sp. PS01301]